MSEIVLSAGQVNQLYTDGCLTALQHQNDR